jgi:uncharacterized SAM-binding protein YcdF (DUF218 family)
MPVSRSYRALAVVVTIAGGVACLLRFGGYLLVAQEPLPSHAQVAVVLQGSINGVIARRAEALNLLQREVVDHVLVSVPATSYWDEPVPEVVHRYFQNHYGASLAERVDLCVCDPKVDSTAEEAVAVRSCLEQHGWRSVLLITSNYHTRRARIIWKEALAKSDPAFTLSVHGVFDGSFQPRGWWRRRIYAKTWLLEGAKLVWISVFGTRVWK